jgi:hypothetical protein
MTSLRPYGQQHFVFLVSELVNRQIAGLVRQAVRDLDPQATIRTDFMTQQLDVRATSARAEDVVEMLKSSGFAAAILTTTAEPSPVGGGLLPADALGPLAR